VPTGDTLLAILLGGFGGALLSQVVQIARDGAHERHALRAAARLVRTEVSSNKSLAQIVLLTRMVPGRPRWPEPSNERLGRVLDVLVSELPRAEIADLLGMNALHDELCRVIADARVAPATDHDMRWLRDEWWPVADSCQAMLDFRAGRFWEPLLHPQSWITYQQSRMQKQWADEDFAALMNQAPRNPPRTQ
jgi:hypothetical protein